MKSKNALPMNKNGNQHDNCLLVNQCSLVQESEEQFRNAFEHAAIGMAIVSTSGKFVTVNSALCEMLGYKKRELLQKDFQNTRTSEHIVRKY